MKRIAFAAASLLSCSAFAGLRGSGNLQHETRVVPPFTGVSVSSGIRAEVQIGPQHVDVEADDNVLPIIETVVEDGMLVVRFKQHGWLRTESAIVVHVSAPSITALEASGGSGIRADVASAEDLSIESSGGGEVQVHHVAVKTLRAQVSGGGGLQLDGRADEVKLQLSGGARCKGQELQARDLRIRASGGSTARLAVSDSIHGHASGGSVIRVRGNPEVRVSSSGGSYVETD
jgi:hypothetical protein